MVVMRCLTAMTNDAGCFLLLQLLLTSSQQTEMLNWADSHKRRVCCADNH